MAAARPTKNQEPPSFIRNPSSARSGLELELSTRTAATRLSFTIHYSKFTIPPPAANQEPADAKIGENLSLIVNLLSDHFF